MPLGDMNVTLDQTDYLIMKPTLVEMQNNEKDIEKEEKIVEREENPEEKI